METIRILLVADIALFRAGLRSVLEHEPDLLVCDEASDLGSTMRAVRDKQPDVILLDLHLPMQSGVQVAQQILTDNPDARIIALIGSPDRDTVTRVLQAGVRGYLMKDTHVSELVEAIRCVANGGAVIAPPIAMQVLSEYRRLTTQNNGDCENRFSARDLAMLRSLAQGAGNRDIAQRMFLSEQTVKNELSDIYRRLGVENRTEAVATALRLGLISLDGDPA